MFKVQLFGIKGWYDLKESDDGKTYVTSKFDTDEEAHFEASFSGESYRIVPFNSHPEEWSPYE